MQKKEHTPERMCIICRQRHPKTCLERYVKRRDGDGKTVCRHDPQQRLPGRGYYLCSQPGCQKKFPYEHVEQNSSKG